MAVTIDDVKNLGNLTFMEFVRLPNSFLDGFWMWGLFVLWAIIGMSFYFNQQREKNDGNILTSFGVSSFICFILLHVATFGGLITGANYYVPLIIFLVVIVIFLISKGKRENANV